MVKQIKSCIAKGKTKEAVNLLRSFETTHPKLEKEILSIASRYNILVSSIVKGILDNNEINIERAKIHDSILVICEIVQKNEKNEAIKKTLNHQKLKYGLFALPCLILLIILFHNNSINNQESLNSNFKSNVLHSNTFSLSCVNSTKNTDNRFKSLNGNISSDILHSNPFSLSPINSMKNTDNQYFKDVNGDALPDILRSSSINYSKSPTGSPVTSNTLDSLVTSTGNVTVAMGINATAMGGDLYSSDTTKNSVATGWHSMAQGVSNTINYTFDPKQNATESFNTGMAFNRIGHYRTAELNFTKAIQDSLGFVEAYLNRGIINRKVQNYENAVEDYNTALELSPNNPAILISRSVVYLRINELDKAMEDCNLAIQINPNLAEAYNSKGNILFVQGLYEEAIVEYNKALELKHLYSYSLIGRGMTKYKLHQDSSDIYCADILKAIKLNRSLNLSPFNEICR